MAMSGISVCHECEVAHERQQRKEKDVQWTTYKINDVKGKKPEIVVDFVEDRTFCANKASSCGEKETVMHTMKELWFKFIDALPDNEGRYAVFDYVQPTSSGTFKDAIRFVAWSPETGSIKNKMIYSSTKDTLKKKLDVPKEVFLSSKSADDIEEAFQKLME